MINGGEEDRGRQEEEVGDKGKQEQYKEEGRTRR